MSSTSINIQPCLIGSSEAHNYRLKSLDYVRQELTNQNESWQSDSLTLSQHLDAIRTLVKERTGRSLQKKATPLREGVVVIKEDTTMDQLQKFAQALEDRWGIKTLQIHIHRDEGYMRSKDWKPNLHAHMVFRWISEETGKSPRLGRNQISEMQTLLAECLEMERGVKSDKKHLSSLQFKANAEAVRLEEATKTLGEVSEVKERIKNASEAVLRPIEEILEASKGWIGTDYKKAVRELKQREEAKAVVKVSQDIERDREISKLKTELSHKDQQLEKAQKTIKEKENLLQKIVQFSRSYFGSKFEDFKDEAQEYFRVKMKQFLDLTTVTMMWAGSVMKDDHGNRYSADYEQGKLLINGETIEEREAKQQQKQRQEQPRSRGFKL